MEDFRFYVPTDVRFGKNHLAELPEALAQFGKKVLFVYGGGSIKKSGLYQQVKEQLADFEVTELAGVEPNPKIESVRQGVELARSNDVDVILAVGGGSVIDAAKVISGSVFYDGDAWDVVKSGSWTGNALPLIDVLTLSATGTEMNRNAVISNMAINEKLGMNGKNFIPRVSFLDPSLTQSVSKWQTAAGASDILSHLFEQYFARVEQTDLQDHLAEAIMKTVITHGPIALNEPDNYNSRAELMWASSLALNGLENAGKPVGWTVHPIEHELSAFYDITHGIGLAIVTPRWMAYSLNEQTVAKFVKYGQNVWDITDKDDFEIAREAIRKTVEWYKQMDIPMTLPEVGIDESRLAEMSKAAVEHGGLAEGVFVPMLPADVEAVLQASLTEFEI
ncbi:MAG: iron-containing alcohol dehydrogenase [Lactobacillaceae bacterium]|jgi:alcohol dehydrogenase YqhD (iron-dependent ADH family)|nr:iron-containing alcohol dehydrogenase [Lactobacillaceae bacterium]